jgi:hypothetical protein
VSFPLPVIKDEALQKFCKQHNLYEAVAAGYHYAQKFFPTAKHIRLKFHPPYRDDEPEEAAIIFVIESNMTVDDAVEAEMQFIKVTSDVSGGFYIISSHRFIE